MSRATNLYAYLRAAGLDDSLRLHGLVPERPGESDFDGKTPPPPREPEPRDPRLDNPRERCEDASA